MASATVARVVGHQSDLPVLVAAGAAAVAVGAAAMVLGTTLVLVMAGLVLFLAIAVRPIIGAYLYLAALPFITGIARGSVIPLLRPNEAFQAFIIAAVLAGLYFRFLRGDEPHFTVTPLDRALLVLATLASVWPLAWLLLRARSPSSVDVLATVPLWRFFALYVLYRGVVREPEQVRRCLWIALAGAASLAVIATLQSRNLLDLGVLWASEASSNTSGRGNATLSSAIAVGDYLACSLAVALAWALRGSDRRPLLYATGAVVLLGALGSGQFSAWIALLIAVALVAHHEGQLGRLALRAAPVVLVGVLLVWPVVALRLAGFSSDLGAPSSWIGRIDNLSNFYLPALGEFRWVLGVAPQSILPAPETWRDVIYLESGILWFLWVGGIPLLLGGMWFFVVAIRHARAVARTRSDEIGTVALATWATLWFFTVLTVIDMHLTLRGAGDLLFILLGLSSIRAVTPAAPLRSAGATTPVDLHVAAPG